MHGDLHNTLKQPVIGGGTTRLSVPQTRVIQHHQTKPFAIIATFTRFTRLVQLCHLSTFRYIQIKRNQEPASKHRSVIFKGGTADFCTDKDNEDSVLVPVQ
jgi:hypothetical protein